MMKFLLKTSYAVLKKFYDENMLLEQDTKVLDIGCGSRGNFLGLAEENYIGIDNSQEVIDVNKKKADGTYLLMDAVNIKFEQQSFDYLISTSFFHHISDAQVREFMRKILPIFKDDGSAIFADGIYPDSWLNLPGFLIRRFDRGRFIRKKTQMKTLFEEFFVVAEEKYFRKCFFTYYVLVLKKKQRHASLS